MSVSHVPRTIIAASFRKPDHAATAVKRLRRAGLHSRISIVARYDDCGRLSIVKLPSRFAASAAGAVSGSVVGVSLGALTLMSGLPLPVLPALAFGAVIGILGGAVLGATVGPATALHDMGLPETIARATLPDLLSGHVLVYARVPRHRSDAAKSALREAQPTNVLVAA